MLVISPSDSKTKAYRAVYLVHVRGGLKPVKTFQFGSKGARTFFTMQPGEAANRRRAAWIARHRGNEDWKKIGPAALSRYFLWEVAGGDPQAAAAAVSRALGVEAHFRA